MNPEQPTFPQQSMARELPIRPYQEYYVWMSRKPEGQKFTIYRLLSYWGRFPYEAKARALADNPEFPRDQVEVTLKSALDFPKYE